MSTLTQIALSAPTAVATPKLNQMKASIPSATFQEALNFVPATPQSLIQLLTTIIPLPTGTTLAQLTNVTVNIDPKAGNAIVTVFSTAS